MKAFIEAAGIAGQSDKAPIFRSAMKRKRADRPGTHRQRPPADRQAPPQGRRPARGHLLLPFLPGHHRHRPPQARRPARAGPIPARPLGRPHHRPLQPHRQGGLPQHRREDLDLTVPQRATMAPSGKISALTRRLRFVTMSHNIVEFRCEHVSATEAGDGFQVLFETTRDSLEGYVLIQRHFEFPDGGKVATSRRSNTASRKVISLPALSSPGTCK